ncbi:MAG: hypothetical protein AAF821_00195 [Cyanobacteria bacterium P01_D01_bin.156]
MEQNGYQNGFDHTEDAQPTQADTEQARAAGESMTNALFELLEQLRKAVPSYQNGNGDRVSNTPIEIKLDHIAYYRDGSQDKPSFNLTTLSDVDYLHYALKQSPGKRIGGRDNSITITVGGQPVFKAEAGIVTHNTVPQPTVDQVPVYQPGPQYYSAPQMAAMPVPPMIVQSPVTLERSRDKAPSFLERIDQASEIEKPSVRQDKWMKMKPSTRLQMAIERLFSFKKKGQAVDVAMELLQRYGTRQGDEFVYEAQGYRIRGVGRHVLVEDREGRGLMAFKTKVFGRPAIKSYKLDSTQEMEFLRVHTELADRNFEGISSDPLLRAMQLRGLAPDGDTQIVDDLKALSVSDIARDLLNASGSQPDKEGTRVLDGKQYRIVHSPESLSIYAKGGRGLVFKQQGGTIDSKLTAADTKHFIFVSKELAALQKQRAVQSIQPQVNGMRL